MSYLARSAREREAARHLAHSWAREVRERDRAESWGRRMHTLSFVIPGVLIAVTAAFMAGNAFAGAQAELRALVSIFE